MNKFRQHFQEGKNKPYVRPYKDTQTGEHLGWKAMNKHGKTKWFGKEFKSAAERHAGEGFRDISEKCWTGYKRVPGTKANTPGSCTKIKEDACTTKVKSRYKVWPSAYASGALVRCRKVGAKNWGNKSEEAGVYESLHDWFAKQDWVRMDTKGNIKGQCAREPGEGKPKCLPRAKAHSLGKKGRASAARRKRREDPNPNRSGKAINVRTKRLKEASAALNKFLNPGWRPSDRVLPEPTRKERKPALRDRMYMYFTKRRIAKLKK